jgi:hypothetical protein
MLTYQDRQLQERNLALSLAGEAAVRLAKHTFSVTKLDWPILFHVLSCLPPLFSPRKNFNFANFEYRAVEQQDRLVVPSFLSNYSNTSPSSTTRVLPRDTGVLWSFDQMLQEKPQPQV